MTRRRLPQGLLLGVGLVTGATLLFEVLLTRIFAVTLWYYFGALAISLALLGTTAAALVAYRRAARLTADDHPRHLYAYALRLAAAAPLAIHVHTQLKLPFDALSLAFWGVALLQTALLCAVFYCAGMCVTICLMRYARDVGRVYFVDLAGAAAGSVLVVPLLYWISAPAGVFAVAAAAALAAWSFARMDPNLRAQRRRAVLAAALCLAATAVNDPLGLLRIVSVKSYGTALQEFEFERVLERWSPVSRVAVFAPERRSGPQGPVEFMKVTNDAGAPTRLWRLDGAPDALDPLLRSDLRQAAQWLHPPGDVLIIGPAGGWDVLAALGRGQHRITAVEINPVIVDLVTRRYAHYIGRLFHDPRVTLHLGDGRSFVASSTQRYDLIQITMVDSWSGAAAGAYVFNECGLYTLEAIDDYVEHLRPGGLLSITRYYQWDEALRLTNLVLTHLERRGADDIAQRLAVVVESPPQHRATLLLKNGRFTPDESRRLADFARRCGGSVVYAPHLDRAALLDSEQADTFRALIARAGQPGARDRFAATLRSDIGPVTDDRPFFFYTARWRDAWRPPADQHASRRWAVPVLYGTIALCAAVSLATLAALCCLARRLGLTHCGTAGCGLYFAALGLGFMLVEVAMIQRLTLLLGHPTWSFVLVLSTLLCASGLGSLLAAAPALRRTTSPLFPILLALVLLLLAVALGVYETIAACLGWALPARMVLAIALLTPLGLLMGMALPIGIDRAARIQPALVPWGWGINGAFSVLGSLLAMALGLNWGFKATLLCGAACYAAALAAAAALQRKPPRGAQEATALAATRASAAVRHAPGSQPAGSEAAAAATPAAEATGSQASQPAYGAGSTSRRARRRAALLAAAACLTAIVALSWFERLRLRRAEALHLLHETGAQIDPAPAAPRPAWKVAFPADFDDHQWYRAVRALRYYAERVHSLDLSHTQVTDVALTQLRHFPQLRHVDLSGTSVTQSGAAALQAALPGCTIVR